MQLFLTGNPSSLNHHAWQGLFVDQGLFDSSARSEKGSLLYGSMYFGMCPLYLTLLFKHAITFSSSFKGIPA